MNVRGVLLSGATALSLLILAGAETTSQADLNCDDFANQNEAQLSLNGTFPEDPNGLDRDKDWIACEDFFDLTAEQEARVVPANLASGAARPTPAPAPTPAPTATATPPPAASTAPSSRIDPPADLMAQVASCEVVTVSSRSIAAAGCPGVGSIVLRPPAGTPRMRSQVIIRPGAALASSSERVATAAQVVEPDRKERKRDREQHAVRRKGKRTARQNAARHHATPTVAPGSERRR